MPYWWCVRPVALDPGCRRAFGGRIGTPRALPTGVAENHALDRRSKSSAEALATLRQRREPGGGRSAAGWRAPARPRDPVADCVASPAAPTAQVLEEATGRRRPRPDVENFNGWLPGRAITRYVCRPHSGTTSLRHSTNNIFCRLYANAQSVLAVTGIVG